MKTLLLHCNINEQLFDEHKLLISFVLIRIFQNARCVTLKCVKCTSFRTYNALRVKIKIANLAEKLLII